MSVCFAGARYPPLALISSLLCLLQLGQCCGQTLLSAVQLLLDQLDTSVQGSYITLSLAGRNTKNSQIRCFFLSNGFDMHVAVAFAEMQHAAHPKLSTESLGWVSSQLKVFSMHISNLPQVSSTFTDRSRINENRFISESLRSFCIHGYNINNLKRGKNAALLFFHLQLA